MGMPRFKYPVPVTRIAVGKGGCYKLRARLRMVISGYRRHAFSGGFTFDDRAAAALVKASVDSTAV